VPSRIGTATSLIAVYVGYRLAHLFGRGNKEPDPKTPNE